MLLMEIIQVALLVVTGVMGLGLTMLVRFQRAPGGRGEAVARHARRMAAGQPAAAQSWFLPNPAPQPHIEPQA